ncbi:MAG: peptide deformylase [bacterium]|nr:peptide deformylase [bacterium]
MSILKVARLGHPVLREKARAIDPAQVEHPEVQRLIEDMVDTMSEYAGVGLAAPQVHASLRLFVLQPDPNDEETLIVAINPQVTVLDEKTAEDWEGCLSIPDLHGKVPRNRKVRLEALAPSGNPFSIDLEGYAARVCQHERDHLDGIVFLERMADFSTLCFGEEFRRYWAPREAPEGEKKDGEKKEG